MTIHKLIIKFSTPLWWLASCLLSYVSAMSVSAMSVSAMYVSAMYTGVVHAQPVSMIPVYHYHNVEPFYFEKEEQKKGISLVFVHQLNEFFRKEHPDFNIQFQLMPMERPALNKLLQDGQQGLILWANALWFKRLFNHPYFMPSAPIYWDNDAIISSIKSPIDYEAPDSLMGKHIGGLPGYYYHGVNQLVAEGKIQRTDGDNDRVNLDRLIKGQVDAVIITQTAFNYVKSDYPNTSFYQSFVPQDSYSRHVLITPEYKYLQEPINVYITSLSHNQEWMSVLSDYGLDDLVVPFTLDLNELNNFSIEE